MPGPSKLLTTLDIAGLTCAVECGAPAFGSLLGQAYNAFRVDGPAELALTVEVVEPPAAPRRLPGPYASVSLVDGVLTVDGADFHGTFDTRARRGHVRQPLAAAPFETFLTAVCAWALLERGGFLLHAAGLVDGGGAVAFFGPSGSGKSTVARLVGRGVISDEVVAVTPDAGGYRASGVPWRGRRRSAPLRALYALRQAEGTVFVRLRSGPAAARLLGSVFLPSADRSSVDRFFDTAAGLLARVPCYEMRFTADRSFWSRLPHRALEPSPRPAPSRRSRGETADVAL
ncbi:MAG TPA: hypothetical protein VNO23_03240 [Candidatus Binatia bacterium]|nr:hypothetical protein [Candidatus Binatia bacterium]